jgi:cytochrome c oxidase subunit I+III
VTSVIDARPQYLMILPREGYSPVLAAAGTAACFLLLTVKLVVLAALGAVIALAATLVWLWQTDRGPAHTPVDIGGGFSLPVYATGPQAPSWWATLVVVVVAGGIFASLLFAYGYLWLVATGPWPPAGAALPAWGWPALAALAWVASSVAVWRAGRALRSNAHPAFGRWLVLATALMLSAFAADLGGFAQAGLSPTAHAFGAAVATALGLEGTMAAILTVMAGYALARAWCGHLSAERRVTFDNIALFWHYAVGQAWAGLAAIHLLPRLL